LRLTGELETVGGYPGLFYPEQGVLLLADLHIGYEAALEKEGIHIPASTYPESRMLIEEMLDRTGAQSLVVAGDLKHEFGIPSEQEWVEVRRFLAWLRERRVEAHVVRGNHDNYVISILKREGVGFHEPLVRLGSVAVVHGHQPIAGIPLGVETVVMGHEHPALVLRGSVGSKRRYKCFLRGKTGRVSLVVLPAVTPLASGTDVNLVVSLRSQILSPILREAEIERFTPIVVDPEAGCLEFPPLGVLQRAMAGPRRGDGGLSLPHPGQG